MFLVTMVKFEEQIQRIDMSLTRGTGTVPGFSGDSNGRVADFDLGGDRVDRGDVGRGVSVAAGPCSGRPEESVGAVSMGQYQRSLVCGPVSKIGLPRRGVLGVWFGGDSSMLVFETEFEWG
jgi:hypothetical protein